MAKADEAPAFTPEQMHAIGEMLAPILTTLVAGQLLSVQQPNEVFESTICHSNRQLIVAFRTATRLVKMIWKRDL